MTQAFHFDIAQPKGGRVMRRVSQQEWENEHMHNPMAEGEALAVEDDFLATLDWLWKQRGCNNEDPIYAAIGAFLPRIQALTAHTAASGGEVVWPKRMVNLPCPEGTGDRIIGFRVPDGDPILGDYGLSEPLAWFRKVTIDRVTAPPPAVPADALERLVADWAAEIEMSDENSADPFMRGAATAQIKCRHELAALIPKGADHE